jgi:MYXO-CTERM domain-containing protein
VNDIGTDPLSADTDGGSVDDGTELDNGTDPLNPNDDVGQAGGADGNKDPGCGCATTTSPAGGVLPALGLFLMAVARRREE